MRRSVEEEFPRVLDRLASIRVKKEMVCLSFL